jgi:hypothetical protein
LGDLTPDDLMATLAEGERIGTHFVSSGDRWELVELPPWVSIPPTFPKFVTTDTEVYAYYDSGSSRSSDGRSWQPLDSTQTPTLHGFYPGPGGTLVAAAIEPLRLADGEGFQSLQDLQLPPVLLRSEDGIHWAPPSQPPTINVDELWFSHLAVTEAGFVLVLPATEQQLEVWTSTDGDIWEPVDVPIPIDLIQDDNSQVTVQSSGDTVILAPGRYDDLPSPTTAEALIIERVATH